eukprot:m.48195 g.48195  ORF g.48195 m.48195 type:complete len:804 (-) comp20688_c0_seq1:131-2542(-)
MHRADSSSGFGSPMPNEESSNAALSISEFHHARVLQQSELDQICDNARKCIKAGDRGHNCHNALRKLHNIVAQNRHNLKFKQNLVDQLFAMLVEPEQGPNRLRIFCLAILQELAPSRMIKVDGFGFPIDRDQIPFLLPVLLGDNMYFSNMEKLLEDIIQWPINSAGIKEADLRLAATTFLVSTAVSMPHLIRPLRVAEFNASLIGMLRNVSKDALAAPIPKQTKMFSQTKPKQAHIMEPDGSKIRDFFTVLNISPTKCHSKDQIMSAYAFSAIRSWLDQNYRTNVPGTHDVEIDDITDTVRESMLEYTLRVIQQCTTKVSEERFPGVHITVQAVAIEAVQILDTMCAADPVLVPRLFPDMKRLSAAKCAADPFLQLTIIKFFAHHGEQVVYDLQPSLSTFFGKTLAHHYRNPVLASEALSFCLDYHTHLPSIFVKFWPNILKLLAWAPRTHLGEFLELLPCMMAEEVCIELFHTILDLPVLSAALEQTQPDDKHFHNIASVSTNPGITAALMNYILRQEGGLGGTIDRLEELHLLLGRFSNTRRVQIAAEITPTLLRCFLNTIVTDASADLVQQVVSVMLERILKLFAIDGFTAEIGKVMAKYFLLLFEKCPQLIVDLQKDLVDFVSVRINVVGGKEEFFIHVLWVIGEYAGSSVDPRCTSETVDKFYEVLELFAYEVASEHQTESKYKNIHASRLMTVLISALGKLGARCQDLIPRVLLCLTKIMKQQYQLTQHTSHQKCILERASQVVGTLQRPPIAATVLNQPWKATGKVTLRHSDPTSSLSLLRFASTVGGGEHTMNER